MAEITYADSWVKVCNRALSQLSAQQIQSLSEGSTTSGLCALHLGQAVGSIVESHDWRCLTKRVQLAQLSTDPVYGYSYKYQLPTDFARMISVECGENAYSIESDALLTDADDDVYITYIYYPTDDPTKIPETLLTAITMELCSILALPLTSNNALQERLLTRAAAARQNAVVQDARNTDPDEPEYTYTDELR